MKVEVNITKCVMNNITPNQYILLYFLYHHNYPQIERLFGREEAIKLRNSLNHTKYILSDVTTNFVETIISDHVKLLLGIKDQDVNFWEWYNLYPAKVGNRILRGATPKSIISKKHEAKYLSRVTTKQEHKRICDITERYIALKRIEPNGLKFLQNVETVLNNNAWENWEILTDDELTELKQQEQYGTRIE